MENNYYHDSSGSEGDGRSLYNDKLFVVVRETNCEDSIIDGIKKCLLEGADVNTQHRKGNTILHFVVKKRYQKVVKYLLTVQGIRKDIKNRDDLTAIDLVEPGSLIYSILTQDFNKLSHSNYNIDLERGDMIIQIKDDDGTSDDQDLKPLFFTDLTIDRNLKLGDEMFFKSLETCSNSSENRSLLLNQEPFPSPKIMALFSLLVYNEKQGGSDREYGQSLQLPEGWTLLTTASNTGMGNGYFGAAFLNRSLQQVVLSHRGTEFNTGSWLTNFLGVYLNKNAPRINSAVTFTAIICKALNAANKANDKQFRLSLTGHSMGGWLAQVSTFSAKHIQMKDGVFIKLKNVQEGFHSHTVVFENPGCKKMVTKLTETNDFRYKSSIKLDQLDITCFLSAPNMINGCNLHLGSIYRVFIDLNDMSFYEKKSPLYNLATHKMLKIFKAFEGTPRIEQVLDWPVSGLLPGPEHKQFFQEAKHKNNFHLESKEGEQYAHHYYTMPLNDKSCSLRMFSKEEISLLYTWMVLQKSKFKLDDINRLAKQFGFSDSNDLLPEINIDKEEMMLSCKDKESLKKAVRHVKQLLRWFPRELAETMRAQVASVPTAVQYIFQGESQNYFISLPVSHLDFLDTMGLELFLVSNTHRILFIRTDDSEFQVIKLYNVFRQIKEGRNRQTDGNLQMYLEDKCQTFLEWRQLQNLAKLMDIGSILKSDTSFDNLLVIEFKSEGQSEISDSDCKLLALVFDNLKLTIGKKIVLISSHEIKLPENIATRQCAADINITDLTIEAQKDLLKKETISVQGTNVSLGQLLAIDNMDESSIETFKRLIDSSKLKRFITTTSVVLDIGRELPNLSDLEVAYTAPVNKDTSFQNLHKYILNLNAHASKLPYFIISGIGEEISEAGWKKLLEVKENKAEILRTEFGEQEFKRLVHQYPDRMISWLHSTAGHLHWQQIYHLDFYIKRQFIKRVIIDNTKIAKLTKNNNDLFVFEYSKDCISLMKIFSVTNEEDFFKNYQIIASAVEEEAIIQNNYGKNTHFFVVEERVGGCVVWRRSTGSLDSLRSCVLHDAREEVGEDQLCNGSSKLVILADEPGMGKSTSLTSVSSLIQNSWVIRIDFKHYQTPISKLPYEITIFDAVDFLLTESGSGDNIERQILQHCLETKSSRQVYVLFDGFDEIQEIQSGEIIKKCAQEKAIRLLKFLKDKTTANILVTTRKYPSHLLENELFVFVTKFKKIDEEQQWEFLAKFWWCHLALELDASEECHKDTLQQCARSWHQQAASILGEDISNFMGIPLQMRMFAEVSMEQAKLCIESVGYRNNIDLPFRNVFDLYEIFINMKYDIYMTDKSGLSVGLNKVNRGWLERELTKKHRILGFQQLFPDLAKGFLVTNITDEEIVELNRVGLIQSSSDGTVEFTHRTFAEYFTAELLVHWLWKERGRHPRYPSTEELLLSNVLLEAEYKVCRQFMDNQLEKSLPALRNKHSQIRKLWSFNKKLFFNHNHQTALHISVQENNQSILSYLLHCIRTGSEKDYISFVTSHDLSGDTALSLGAKINSTTTINKLLTQVDTKPQKDIILSTVLKSLKNKDSQSLHINFLMKYTLETENCWKLEPSFLQNKWLVIESILKAARTGSMEDLKKALSKADDDTDLRYLLSAVDHKGATALHIAAKSTNYEMVEYLLENHAEVDSIDYEAMTPLMYVSIAKSQDLKTVKYLIAHGANIVHHNCHSMTALSWAAKSGHLDIVKYLFNLNSELLKISDINRITPFQHAAKSGYLKVVQFLFERGADIDGQDRFGMSALTWAARRGHLPVVKYLLQQDAEIDQRDRYGMSSLQIAIKASNWKVAEFLVANKAEVNSADWNGTTALQRAIKAGKWDLVQNLIKAGADVKIVDASGKSPLHYAVKVNKLKIAKLMLEHGALISQLEEEQKKILINY